MLASELINKVVLRSGPVMLPSGNLDYSYTTTPLLVKKVTDSHIYLEGKKDVKEVILNELWMDNKWVVYEGYEG